MRRYDGLFILRDALTEERVTEVTGLVRSDLEKQGAVIQDVKPMGRRSFARALSKKDAGHYVRIIFDIDPNAIQTLTARYKLNEDIFRFQLSRLEEKAPQKPAAVEKGA